MYKIREVHVKNFSEYKRKTKTFYSKVQNTNYPDTFEMRECVFLLVRKKILLMNERRKKGSLLKKVMNYFINKI